ncbi:hypothetical protein ACFV9D_21560 [Streptomyces sp. NPDC059875]|uniref:hypothetical protein n=1 Tax=unclassified Streptomyces TaxID=2593676 RepID=UPI00365DBAC3
MSWRTRRTASARNTRRASLNCRVCGATAREPSLEDAYIAVVAESAAREVTA